MLSVETLKHLKTAQKPTNHRLVVLGTPSHPKRFHLNLSEINSRVELHPELQYAGKSKEMGPQMTIVLGMHFCINYNHQHPFAPLKNKI